LCNEDISNLDAHEEIYEKRRTTRYNRDADEPNLNCTGIFWSLNNIVTLK